MSAEPVSAPLRVGDRVVDKKYRTGVITFRRVVAGREEFMVRWNGNRHESGAYGAGSLKRTPRQR